MDSQGMKATTTTWSWILVWYWTLFGSFVLSWFVIIVHDKKRRSKLPPGPPGWPIVGNLFHLGKKPHESLFHLAKQYGPLITLRLGMKTAVVVSSPAMAKEFLKNNDQLFAGRIVPQAANCVSYSKSSLAWSQYGPRWRMLRRICNTELFSANRLNALQYLRRNQVFQTIRQIYDWGNGKQRTVNIGQTAFLVGTNLLGNMIFGQNIIGRDYEAEKELKETLARLSEIVGTPNLADFFPFLQFLDPQGVCRDMTAYLKRMFGLLDKVIEDRLSSSTQTQNSSEALNRGDFLDALLAYKTDGDAQGPKFTRADMTPFLNEIFAAGSETTGTTIEWAMAELLRNPHTMKKAQVELDGVVGRHRMVEESDIQHLHYLHAVVKETFRLHPAAPLLLPHRAEISCEIAGYAIPKHSLVIVNVWAIGRDPSLWNSVLEFIPERFMNSKIDYNGNDFELIPFGAGRRICPGLQLGSRMVHFVLASLLHSFDWCLPDGQIDMADKFGITLQKALPLIAIPTPRLPTTLF